MRKNTILNPTAKIWRTVICSAAEFDRSRFGDENTKGRYLIQVKDYSDLENVKLVREFRCDEYSAVIVGDWMH